MDGSRREQIGLGIERLGYVREPDGKYLIPAPFRKLEKEELEHIFYDGLKWSRHPRLNFDNVMEELGKAERKALLEKLGDLKVCPEELEDMVRIEVPREEHLRQIYRGNIGVDTGDGGSNYSLNTLEPGYMGRLYGCGYHVWDRASIAWLTKQQGYRKRDLSYGLHCVEDKDNDLHGYIKSAAYEIWHELTGQNQLFFLLELTLEQIMLLFTCVQWKRHTGNWPGYVVLDKSTRTGFFDSGSGSGSLMRVQPERDVKLPIKYIANVFPDNLEVGYSVLSVYESRSMWKNGGLKRVVLPKKFRRDMESLGFGEDPEKIFLLIEKAGQL